MSTGFWRSFPVDPRDPANAAMRASDADRALVTDLLTEAYADGRLSRDEHDERTTALGEVRVLGDVRPLVDDLVGAADDLGSALAARAASDVVGDEQIRAQAEAHWRRQRRESLVGFIGPSTLCVVIWALAMLGEFFWPAFVILGTAMNVVRVQVQREDIIDDRVHELEQRRARELGAGTDEVADDEDDDTPSGPTGGRATGHHGWSGHSGSHDRRDDNA